MPLLLPFHPCWVPPAPRPAGRRRLAAALLAGALWGLGAAPPAHAQAHRIAPAAPGLLEVGAPFFAVRGYEALGLNSPPTDLHVLPDGRILVLAGGQLALGDGVRWEVFQQAAGDPPLASTAVAVDANGRIFAGSEGGFGRIEFQDNGQWRLRFAAAWPADISPRPPLMRVAIQLGDEWYWHGDSGPLVAWRPGETPRVLGQADVIDSVLRLGEARYFSDRTSGALWRVDGAAMEPVPYSDSISINATLTCGTAFDPGRLLVGTYARGLMVFDGIRTRPFAASGPLADGVRINSLCATEGGYFAAAVENLGVVFFDRQGRTVQVLDRRLDHRLSHVRQLQPAAGGVVWALVGDGVLSVKFPARVSQFEPLIGSSLATAHPYRLDGKLWLMADGKIHRGVYDEDGRLSGFAIDTPPNGFAFALSVAAGRLIAGTDRGAFYRSAADWVPFAPRQTNLRVLDPQPVDGRWLYGAQGEVGWLRPTAAGFELETTAAPSLTNLYNAETDADGTIWIEMGNGRVGRLRVAAGRPEFAALGRAEGLPEGWVQVFVLDGHVEFNLGGQMFQFDAAQRRFQPDPGFSRRFPDVGPILGRPIQDALGRLWLTAGGAVRVFEKREGSWRELPEEMPPGLAPYFLCCEAGGVVWMHAERRLERYDPALPAAPPVPFRARFTRVDLPLTNRSLFAVDRPLPPLDFSDNSLGAHFVALGPPFAGAVTFEVRFDGAATEWVSAGSGGSAVFNRLKEGRYELQVRPRSGTTVGLPASLAFVIRAPWYRTNFAYAGYLLAAAGTLGLIAWLSSYLQRRENVRLERLVARRTRELHESNVQLASQVEEIQRLSQAIEQSPVGVVLIRPDGTIVFANPRFCELSGYGPAEISGRKLDALRVEPPPPELAERIAAGAAWHGQLANRTRDGRIVRVRVTHSPIRSPDGTVRFHLVLEEDITEWLAEQERRRRLEAQLLQAQKLDALGTLAGGIAHDFNNILMGILGYCELATLAAGENAEVRQELAEIRRAGFRARDLVAQILTFSRQGPAQLVPVDLAAAVTEALKLLRASIPATIEFVTALQPGPIRGDPTQIQQVVVNLCTNAAHALRDRPGHIRIDVQRAVIDERLAGELHDLAPGEFLCLTVSDDGHGMDQATLDRIFEPFFTTKKPGEGTGLGLAIVRAIVVNHDGALRVRSVPEVGTTFELYFPASTDQPDPSAHPAPVPTGSNEEILVVDDERSVGSFVAVRLRQLGYRSVVFHDPAEALTAFQEEPRRFRAVITDLTMPHMTGVELIQQIRAGGPAIPAIIMSGYGQHLTDLPPGAVPHCAFIAKPFSGEDLGRLLDQVMNAGRAATRP